MISDQDWLNEWNSLHINVVSLGADFRNASMVNFLEEVIIRAKEAYYNGNPIMSDTTFDRFERWLRTLCPKSTILKLVGSKN